MMGIFVDIPLPKIPSPQKVDFPEVFRKPCRKQMSWRSKSPYRQVHPKKKALEIIDNHISFGGWES